MKITEDVRKYAAEKGLTDEAAISKGLEEKATEFAKAHELYQKI
jgi:phosphomethylpyrimidine synthase